MPPQRVPYRGRADNFRDRVELKIASCPHQKPMAGRPSFAQLAARLMQQQGAKAGFGGAGGAGGAGGGQNLGKAVGGGAGVIALAAAGLALNSALFNGEHRIGTLMRHPISRALARRAGL